MKVVELMDWLNYFPLDFEVYVRDKNGNRENATHIDFDRPKGTIFIGGISDERSKK